MNDRTLTCRNKNIKLKALELRIKTFLSPFIEIIGTDKSAYITR